MKRNAIATSVFALFAALSGSAYASDLNGGLKDDAAAYAGHSVDWTGIYAGVQGGWMNANHEINVPFSHGEGEDRESGNLLNLDGLNSSGFIGGGVVGFDKQINNWVIGVQAYYHIANVETTLAAGVGEDRINASLEKENEWGGILRAGPLLSPRVLAYGLVGWNQAEYSLHASDSDGKIDLGDDVKRSKEYGGIIAGAGVEYALTRNVFVGAEYTHFFGGEETWYDNGDPDCNVKVTDDLSEDRVMATLKVKLGGGLFD